MEDHDAYDQPLPEYPEAVRMRPGMYIGDTGVRGLHHLFKEIIDSSMDEVLDGHCTRIDVVLGADGSLSVADDGRAIPTRVVPESGKPFLELVFTELNAGRKFGDGGYQVGGGLQGIGASCVSALSDFLECIVRRDGKVYRMRFERGVPVTGLEVVGECGANEHGTTVQWLADRTMFVPALDAGGNLGYDAGIITRHLRERAYLLPNTRITFTDHRHGDPTVRVFHYPNGGADYVRELNQGYPVMPDDPIFIRRRDGDPAEDKIRVTVALQYSDRDGETLFSFANSHPCIEHGTHVTGFRRALTRAINETCGSCYTGEVVRRGLTAVVSVFAPDIMWSGTSRDRVVNLEVEGAVFSVVYAGLMAHFKSHPGEARLLGELFASR